MYSFLVFDSKGAEVLGPKAISTHNNTKSTNLKFKILGRYRDSSGSIQLVSSYKWFWLWEDQKGENPIWEWPVKRRKVDYGVKGGLSP